MKHIAYGKKCSNVVACSGQNAYLNLGNVVQRHATYTI